ncbi:MAG: type II toxin-antitoxin system HicB family antitoxin [Methanolinea sp.]|jgi:predicted RNase H-like HicB family nuclease|nr:type II toxin-antitoxin system HicB family antitoxin [Methanolinea sp.]
MARGISMEKTYSMVIEPGEDGWFVVTVPAIPGCITQGKTIEEAEKNAKEAIEAYIESLIRRRKGIPDQQGVAFRKVSVEV